jgi:PPP family 3-phenylpropionic acid transporter
LARWDAPTWLVIAAAASVLRFSAVAVGGASLAVLVAAQLLHALTFAAQHAACIALLNRWFSGALRGRGQALYTTLGYGVSGVIGGVLGGAISEQWGFAAVFAAAALAAAAALGCCWRCRELERQDG